MKRSSEAELGPLIKRVAVVIGITTGLALIVATLSGGGGTYRVTATFDDARGLISGGSVRAGGIDVGHVVKVSFDDAGLPEAELQIDDDFRLHRTSTANIRLASNAGGVNRYVDLTLGDGPLLHDGAAIGRARTDSPVNLDQALSALDPHTRAEVGDVLAAVDRGNRDRGQYVARTLRHSAASLAETAQLLGQVGADRTALRTLVADGRQVVGAMASSPLVPTADHLATVLAATGRRQVQLAHTTQLLGPGLVAARGALLRFDQAIPNLERVIRTTGPALNEVPGTVALLAPAIDDLAPLLQASRRLLEAAPAQLRALQQAIDAVTTVFPLLGPTLRGLSPVLNTLRVQAPEFVGFFTLLGDATANYDANGNALKVSPVLIESQRYSNFVGADSALPGLLDRPFTRTPGALEGDPWKTFQQSFVGKRTR